MQTKSNENLSSSLANNTQYLSNYDAKVPTKDKKTQNEQSHSRQITYKIKDGLYLATSLDAFKDDEFILLNWIQHIVVLENEKCPFDSRLKGMYGQEDDETVEEGQEVIRYLHFDESMFRKGKLQKSAKDSGISDDKMDDSLIRQLHQPTDQNKLAQTFSTLYNFIEQSHSFGSSCLIIPSNPDQDIDDLSSIFSICTAYLMTKYKWSLYKALQFMNSRLKDVNLSETTYEWLNRVEIQLLEQENLTYNWESYQSSEELVLRNTYLNTKKIVCDNGLRRLEMNGQTSSRQKLKSKYKFENPLKKPSLTNRTYQSSQNGIKSILKSSDSSLNLRSQRKRIEFNTSLNQIKEYEVSARQIDYEQENSKIECKNQKDSQKSFDSSNSSSFLSASRNRKISLCVSKIVSKYREQRNLSQRNKSKPINFDKLSDITFKGMIKKKSYYNFESCKSLANHQKKDLKSDENEQISKILKKIKIKQNFELTNEEKIAPIISLTQPSISDLSFKDGEKVKMITENGDELSSTKRQSKNSPKNDIIRKNSLNTKQSILQPSSTFNIPKPSQSITYRSHQKLRQLKPQNHFQSQSRTKYDQKKQNSIDKLNGSTKIYIKEVKTQKSSQRKQSMKENIDNAQKHRQKNLMIEYEDFKEMIKKKQKSIGNLVSNHVIEERVLKEKPTNYLTSVIEKLKKDVSEIQLSMNQSNIMKRPQQIIQQKQTNPKTPTFKWR